MKKIPLGELHYKISRLHTPRICIDSGTNLVVETEDAFTRQITEPHHRRDFTTMPGSNPLSGPIYINNALPGDTLKIKILKISSLTGQAATKTDNLSKTMEATLGSTMTHGTRICKIKGNEIIWDDNIKLPYKPMIGSIGTAPATEIPTSGKAGNHGGNMDVKEVTEDSTLYLPIFVEGALLHIGDVHARQGDGELSGTGLEMAASIKIHITLLKNNPIEWPRIENSQEIMAICTGLPMEISAEKAYAELILWMEKDYKIPRWAGYNLCTHVGTISVGFLKLGTIGAKIEKRYLRTPKFLS